MRIVRTTFALLTVAIAGMTLAGWATGDRVLTAWSASAVSMKVITAIVLLTQGAALLSWHLSVQGRRGFLFFASMLNWAAFSGLFSSVMLYSDAASADRIYYFPSLATIVAFFLIGLRDAQLLFLPDAHGYLLSWAVVIIGASSALGYMLDVPTLYFFIPPVSTAVAINTSVCLILIGVSLPRPA